MCANELLSELTWKRDNHTHTYKHTPAHTHSHWRPPTHTYTSADETARGTVLAYRAFFLFCYLIFVFG